MKNAAQRRRTGCRKSEMVPARIGCTKGRAMLFCLASFMFAASTMAATSDPTTVFLRPERSSFWRTATNSTVELRIDYPDGATKAELIVQGGTFAVRVPDITLGSYLAHFPEPTSPDVEDVYSLVLAFDNGVTNTATLAVVRGSGVAEPVVTSVLPPDRKWRKVGHNAVLPIPFGTTELAIDGEPIATGLDGAQGWYGWRRIDAGSHTLYLATESESVEVQVDTKTGFILIYR